MAPRCLLLRRAAIKRGDRHLLPSGPNGIRCDNASNPGDSIHLPKPHSLPHPFQLHIYPGTRPPSYPHLRHPLCHIKWLLRTSRISTKFPSASGTPRFSTANDSPSQVSHPDIHAFNTSSILPCTASARSNPTYIFYGLSSSWARSASKKTTEPPFAPAARTSPRIRAS